MTGTVRPFARPDSLETLRAFRDLVRMYQDVSGKPMTQELLDLATEDAGLPYRIDLDLLRGGMA